MTTTTPDSSLQPALDALHGALGSAFFPPGAVPTRNRNDYSGLAPTDPLAVARPADTAGVAATLRICNEHGVAVVPQGGLTGLCGGARAGSREVALWLERLVGIEEIDPASATEFVLRRPAVWAIGQGQRWEPAWRSPEVYAGLQHSVASELGVIDQD